jgi:amidophosphoribosyltransferase
VREVEPGEMVVIDKDGLRSMRPFVEAPPSHCIFEHVYFARPDSRVFGRDVHQTRLALGRQLAREAPADADVVVPVPDSGTVAAVGYSQESGLPIEFGLIRNHYVGRTFIEPRQSIRHFGVKVKLNPVRSVIEGRRIVLIDDSIVRGTTSRKIVGMVRHAGAKEIHLRISSPPTTGPCHYGIDTPKREELIAATHSIAEITRFVDADSLGYLSHEGLLSAVAEDRNRYCSACFSGKYPVPLPEEGRDQLKLFEKVRE